MWARDLVPNFPMIGNCILGNRQGYFSQGLLIGLRIINRPQSKPHQFAFYDMWGEGCLLLPRSSRGTLLLDLRPEAGYTFDPFWSTNLLQKVYVCVCERFLCSLFCPIGTHMGEQRCSGGFCNTVSRTQSVTKHVCRVQVQANI